MKHGVPSNAVRTAGVRAHLTELDACEVRHWEQHVLIAPARSKGRHRLYTEADPVPLADSRRLAAAAALEPGYWRDRFVERLPTRAVGPIRSA